MQYKYLRIYRRYHPNLPIVSAREVSYKNKLTRKELAAQFYLKNNCIWIASDNWMISRSLTYK
jgi:hypothetical protein